MRISRLTFTLLALSSLLLAADPFAGTWKLSTSKSKYKTGAVPKEQTLTIMEMGKDLHIKVAGTAADGGKIGFAYTTPATGGSGKFTEGTAYDGVTTKRISANEREVTYLKGGKAVYTSHSVVSADGKTITLNAKGVNALGQPIEGTVIYEKQ